MAATVVVILGALAIGVALAIAVKWGNVRLQPEAWPADGGSGTVAGLGRSLCIAMSAGGIAGLLVGGFGGRLAMRVLAATSGDAAQGKLTDAEEAVGTVSLGGTVGILLFVGLGFGFIGGLLFVGIRRWLPRRGWKAGLVFGLLTLVALAPLDPLSRSNEDFDLLHPVGLAVALIAVLFPIYGMTTAALVSRFDQSYPALARKPQAGAPLVLLLLATPLAFGALVVAGTAHLTRSERTIEVWHSPAVSWTGRCLLAIAGAAFAVSFASTVVDLLG